MPEPSHHLLAELLALAGLTAGTAEYCSIIRRRARARLLHAERAASEEAEFQRLVFVLLTETDSADGSGRPGFRAPDTAPRRMIGPPVW